MPPANFVDLTGESFGEIIVIERAPNVPGHSATFWLCKCNVCGQQKTFRTDKLRTRKATSCGCRNPFRKTMQAAVTATKHTATSHTETSALVAANDAMRQAMDDELMARLSR